MSTSLRPPLLGEGRTRLNPVLVGLLIAAMLAAGVYFAYRLLSPPVRARSVARAAMQGAAAADECRDRDRDATRSAGRAALRGATLSHTWHGFDHDVMRSAARAVVKEAVASHAWRGFDRDACTTGACSRAP